MASTVTDFLATAKALGAAGPARDAYNAQRNPLWLGDTGVSVDHFGTYQAEINNEALYARKAWDQFYIMASLNGGSETINNKQWIMTAGSYRPEKITFACQATRTISGSAATVALPSGDAQTYEPFFKEGYVFSIAGNDLSAPAEVKITDVNRSAHTIDIVRANDESSATPVLNSGTTYDWWFQGSKFKDGTAAVHSAQMLTEQDYNMLQFFGDKFSELKINRSFSYTIAQDTFQKQLDEMTSTLLYDAQTAFIFQSGRSRGKASQESMTRGLLGMVPSGASGHRWIVPGDLEFGHINEFVRQMTELNALSGQYAAIATSKTMAAWNNLIRERWSITNTVDQDYGFGVQRIQTDYGTLDVIVCDLYANRNLLLDSTMNGANYAKYQGRWMVFFDKSKVKMKTLSGWNPKWTVIDQEKINGTGVIDAYYSAYQGIDYAVPQTLGVLTWPSVANEAALPTSV